MLCVFYIDGIYSPNITNVLLISSHTHRSQPTPCTIYEWTRLKMPIVTSQNSLHLNQSTTQLSAASSPLHCISIYVHALATTQLSASSPLHCIKLCACTSYYSTISLFSFALYQSMHVHALAKHACRYPFLNRTSYTTTQLSCTTYIRVKSCSSHNNNNNTCTMTCNTQMAWTLPVTCIQKWVGVIDLIF